MRAPAAVRFGSPCGITPGKAAEALHARRIAASRRSATMSGERHFCKPPANTEGDPPSRAPRSRLRAPTVARLHRKPPDTSLMSDVEPPSLSAALQCLMLQLLLAMCRPLTESWRASVRRRGRSIVVVDESAGRAAGYEASASVEVRGGGLRARMKTETDVDPARAPLGAPARRRRSVSLHGPAECS